MIHLSGGRRPLRARRDSRPTISRWAATAAVFLGFFVMLFALLAAGSPGEAAAGGHLQPTTPSADAGTPTSTPRLGEPKELAICQQQEPNTLFIYGGPSRGARNVLEAIYDGPIDTLSYEFQPVILEKLPNLDDGDAIIQTVQVEEGDRVLDARGGVVQLLRGAWVTDADGRDLVYNGGTITMPQMVVTFTLRADIVWADGQPLTADDSLCSFELSGEFKSPSVRLLCDRTFDYEAADEQTIVWSGVPGYVDSFYFLNFYYPLPRHVWGLADADTLTMAEVARRRPLGWGPFVVEEWAEGDHITLVRNPHYF
ncbi:MAG: hypothetical protein E3J64_07390, partial [Anaerolineales bacterium]